MSHNVDDFRSYQTLHIEHIIPTLGPKFEYLPHKIHKNYKHLCVRHPIMQNFYFNTVLNSLTRTSQIEGNQNKHSNDLNVFWNTG